MRSGEKRRFELKPTLPPSWAPDGQAWADQYKYSDTPIRLGTRGRLEGGWAAGVPCPTRGSDDLRSDILICRRSRAAADPKIVTLRGQSSAPPTHARADVSALPAD
jgi:hypothetical protein